ncbi:hypothetical protein TRAPUB_10453 [Trametes pubescens]|uniref:Uncharacterized protein n=1 Tax=Trametes pubescens TaxID=154538 RepID=A0A1M2VZM0_TRAPU|nr:hypothetical protein TRAPUB_10453 [Trametes pubescens]
MHALSKLIVCAVMLRGRHRGLPVALDRAVLMPREFLIIHDGTQDEGGDEKESEDGRMHHMQVLHDPDELATRMRLRTRTISLIVEERREAGAKEAAWAHDRVPEESRDVSVGSAGSERNV